MNYWIRHVNDQQRYDYSGAVSELSFLFSSKEDSNYLMSRGCVSLFCCSSSERIISWHEFCWFSCSPQHINFTRDDSAIRIFERLSLSSSGHTFYRRAWEAKIGLAAVCTKIVQFINENIKFCRRRWWRSALSLLTYVVLVVRQHWTKGHKILCWRCRSRTEVWGIFRPQKGRQR